MSLSEQVMQAASFLQKMEAAFPGLSGPQAAAMMGLLQAWKAAKEAGIPGQQLSAVLSAMAERSGGDA